MVRISLVHTLTPLYLYVSTFRSMSAVPSMAVFCSSLTSWFPGMLLTYFLNDFEMVPVAPIIAGITFVFTFHMRCIYIVRSLYFRIFSASFLITFLSPEIATSINIHVLFSLSRIMSGLLLGMVLSVWTCWFHSMVTLPPWHVYYYYYYYYLVGRDSAIGIATRYGLDDPRIESRWGRVFPHLSRPTLGPTRPPVQWTPSLSRGQRAAAAWRWPTTPI